MQFELRKLKRWSTTMKYDTYFATQYKECFVFFGVPTGTSVATKEVNQMCTMSGCVATLVEVDNEDGYIWSPMPHVTLQLLKTEDNYIEGSIQICGGYTSREEIKLLGIVTETMGPGYLNGDNYTPKHWTTSLAMPFSKWSENATFIAPAANQKVKIPSKFLAAVQKCKQFVIYFYLTDHFRSTLVFGHKGRHPFSESAIIINDEENKQSCLFLTDSVTFDGHVSSAVVGDDLFLLSRDKMAKVEKFTHLLVASAANTDQNTKFTISFDLTVPHTNSTLFVIQDTLCVVGGCDDNYEPFSDIYQFDQGTQEWNECGVSSVSRYAASVVTFTDRKQKEAVFIAGGFKGKDMPCSIIEVLTISG